MKSAVDPAGEVINILDVRNADGSIMRKGFTCPCCGSEVEVAFGFKRQYFRHKRENSTCLASIYDHQMTEWHNDWQDLFPQGSQEFYAKAADGSFRRADVLLNDCVIEFQHSQITDEEVKARSEFYLNEGYSVIWIFDMRHTWSIEDFVESCYMVENRKLLALKEYHAADNLPTGMRAVDTDAVILIAEVACGTDEFSLLRLFKKDKKLLGFNYGSSRSKVAGAIINGKLKFNPEIVNIKYQKSNRIPEDSDRISKDLQAISKANKEDNSLNTLASETEEDISNEIEIEYSGLKSESKIFNITNNSTTDMTRMIEFALLEIDCRIESAEIISIDNNEYIVQYKIVSKVHDRRSVLKIMNNMANEGFAPLYGAHFY